MKTWIALVSLFYYVAFFIDPLVLVFQFKPIHNEMINFFVRASNIVFIIDILVNCMTATEIEEDYMIDDDNELKQNIANLDKFQTDNTLKRLLSIAIKKKLESEVRRKML